MAAQASDLLLAKSFGEANDVLTKMLAPDGRKPNASDFGTVQQATEKFIAAANTIENNCEGLAFVGRLWTITSWRSGLETSDWSTSVSTLLLGRIMETNWLERLASWGGADERRHAGTALSLTTNAGALDVVLALFATEGSRKATKVTLHNLELIRKLGAKLEAIVDSLLSVWAQLLRGPLAKSNAPCFWFENSVNALIQLQWHDREIGQPKLSDLPSSVSGFVSSAPKETRDEVARRYLDLLQLFRQATARRRDLSEGYRGAVNLSRWSQSTSWLSSLGEPYNQLVGDLEADLVARLELGIPETDLRDFHQKIVGSVASNVRLSKLAENNLLDERASYWLKTGKWREVQRQNLDLAEAAAQDLDSLIAELIIELGPNAAPLEAKMVTVKQKVDTLASKRDLEIFGRPGEIVRFDPSGHTLAGDGLRSDGAVKILKPGVARSRSGSKHVVVKAIVVQTGF